LSGKDPEEDFLEEFLFLLDSEGLVLSEIISLSIKEGFDLMCEFYCDKADGYDFKGDIKSITYNNMSISEEPGKVTIQAVVDI